MYLEISGRRTGKTTRLVRELNTWLLNTSGGYATLVTPNRPMFEHLTHGIDPKFRDRVKGCSDIETSLRWSLGKFIFEDARVHRIFIDEFDFCNPRSVPIFHNGYYVTTPKFVRSGTDLEYWRDDILLTLLVESEFCYESHTSLGMFHADGKFDIDRIRGMCNNIGKSKFQCEILSNFVSIPHPEKELKEGGAHYVHSRRNHGNQ